MMLIKCQADWAIMIHSCLGAAVTEWLAHLSINTVARVESPAGAGFIFPDSKALGYMQPQKNGCQTIFKIFIETGWESKATNKGTGHPRSLLLWPRQCLARTQSKSKNKKVNVVN